MPIKVAVALLLKDGCVLMGERRPEKVYPLHWEFPGGKLEDGETATEAMKRELQEELAIDIQDAEEFMSEVATYSNGMTYDIRYYLVRSWHGEVKNQEFHRVLWVSNEALPTLLHLSGNKNILDRFAHEGIPS
jgi:8-oxo-dGTP diphosphatase